MACCIFKGCFNKPTPFGTVTFFNLPKDEPRRGRWLWLSGNADVQNLPANARRLVCEEHFEERYLRRQFHRTTLSREAVPMEHHQVRKEQQATTADEVLIDEIRENVKNEETPATDQEEILLISADEESDYEVLVEESETLQETGNEDHETHLIEVEESYDGHEVIDTTQDMVIGDRNTLIRCREDAVVLDGLAQESKNVVDTILIDFEESGEEQKSQEIVEHTEESQLEVIQHECVAEDKPGEKPQETQDLVEFFVIDDVESSEVHKALASIPQDITITKQNSEQRLEDGKSVQEHKTEAKEEEEVTNKKPQVIVTYSAKHKLPHNVKSTQQTKRFKNDEVVEPDTSSQRVPPKPQVVATEQLSTSSCTSSVPVSSQIDLPKPQVVTIEQPSTSSCTSSVPAPPATTAPGKMSEEEYFAMSLVGPLQRLPPERRAIAKMKILTYLVQLECGMTDAGL